MTRLRQIAAVVGPRFALAPALVAPALAAKPEVDKLSPTVVRDLHFGDGLFYYYQGKDFEAITRLLAYQQWGRLPHHERRPICCWVACTCRWACTTRRANDSKRC